MTRVDSQDRYHVGAVIIPILPPCLRGRDRDLGAWGMSECREVQAGPRPRTPQVTLVGCQSSGRTGAISAPGAQTSLLVSGWEQGSVVGHGGRRAPCQSDRWCLPETDAKLECGHGFPRARWVAEGFGLAPTVPPSSATSLLSAPLLRARPRPGAFSRQSAKEIIVVSGPRPLKPPGGTPREDALGRCSTFPRCDRECEGDWVGSSGPAADPRGGGCGLLTGEGRAASGAPPSPALSVRGASPGQQTLWSPPKVGSWGSPHGRVSGERLQVCFPVHWRPG